MTTDAGGDGRNVWPEGQAEDIKAVNFLAVWALALVGPCSLASAVGS